jgi:amino acid adenylation domain-containing protein
LLSAAQSGPPVEDVAGTEPFSAADAMPVFPLAAWNATEAPFPDDRTLHGLFFAQAARSPDALAIVDEECELTYAELARRVNSLARALADRGAGPNRLVGICLDRSADMIAALLAALATGAAYVPLDPTYPADRLSLMVKDARVALVLTQRSVASALPALAAPVVMLDDVDFSAIAPAPAERVSASDLAYVVYTSGSTGQPKGVEVRHRSVINLLFAMRRLLDISAEDRVLAVANISFDMSVPELYLAPLFGAVMIVVSRADATDGRRLLARWQRSGATVMQATPVSWRMLIEAGWQGSPGLKLVCGGEALDPDLARQLVARAGRFWQFYGPTETTVWSTVQEVSRVDGARVPIGRPLANTRLYILDDARRPVPIGSAGELYIGGIGVARGYLRHPDLTAQRFFDDPVAGRMYQTGDLARFLPDGTVEFLGRADDQVKLRGFRIEPGEIEAVLGEHPWVRQPVVVAQPGASDDRQLVAFIVGADPELRSADLRQFVRSRLPDYMVPSRFVAIDTLPLTPNGKVDRQRLQAMAAERPERAGVCLPPRDALEKRLVAIFERLLNIHPVGIHDDFFEFGGTSLQAFQLLESLHDGFEPCVQLSTLYEDGATVARMAERLRDSATGASFGRVNVEPAPIAETLDQAEAYFADECLLIRNRKTEGAVAMAKRRFGAAVREVPDFAGFLAAAAGWVRGANVIVALGGSTTANFPNWPGELAMIPAFCRSGTVILNLADYASYANSHVERLELTLGWLRQHGAAEVAVIFLGGLADGHASHHFCREYLLGARADPSFPRDARLEPHRFGGELQRLNREPPAGAEQATAWVSRRIMAIVRLLEQICADAQCGFFAWLQPLPYLDLSPGYQKLLRRIYDDATHPGSFEIWRRDRNCDEAETRPVLDALRRAWRTAEHESRHGIYLDYSDLFSTCDHVCFTYDGLHYDTTASYLIAQKITTDLPEAFKERTSLLFYGYALDRADDQGRAMS